MINLPTLPPLPYRLWLPTYGTYVRGADQLSRRIVGTFNRDRAMQLPEPLARAAARELIRSGAQTIELRPVQPDEAAGDAGQVERSA